MATEVLPPAPNAAQLGKFGGLNPSLFTGAAQEHIGLYTIQTRDLKVPISLSYSSNGVRVDEISSRAGTNWVLNFGGVINRTVYDVPDEFGTFKSPPTSFNNQIPSLYGYLKTAVTSDFTGQDTQPDIFNFSFNGASGRFILDSLKRPVLIDKANLKIEPNFSGTDWSFKITAGNGDQYFFGGGQATESSKTYTGGGTSCGKTYGSPIPTAWYLNKIKSIKGDSIVFKYTALNYFYSSSVNESLTRTAGGGAGSNCPGEQTTCGIISNDLICSSSLSTQGVALSEVDFDQGKVTIGNIARGDVQGDILIGNINVYSNAKTAVLKQFVFSYQTSNSGSQYISNSYIGAGEKARHFLQTVTEKDFNATVFQKYIFTYEDINGLPPRLSFAQDHFGYFNGKNNSMFVPPSKDPNVQVMFPVTMGNRDPDSLFAKKGLLTKIVYPTGGSDSLVYEPHKGFTTISIPATATDISTNATGTGTRTGVSASANTSSILMNTSSTLTLICDGLAGSGPYDTVHQFAEAGVYDMANPGVRLLYLKALPSETQTGTLSLVQGHTYTVKVTAYGSVIAGGVDLSYTDKNPTTQTVIKQLGGMRVSKVVTTDPVQNNVSVKRYYYSTLLNLGSSSGHTVIDDANILYYKDFRTVTSCESFCTYSQGSSSSMYNLFIYNNDNVVYDSVIEGFGNNFENGGIEHLFTVHPDVPSHIAMGNDIKGAPLSNIGWDNGQETNTNYFKRNGAGYSYTRKVYNHFKQDSRAGETHFGYVITSEFTPIEHSPLASIDYDQFDVLQYNINSYWVYKDTTRSTDFDVNQNPISTKLDISYFDNPLHLNMTRNLITKSNGKLLTTLSTFPQDYTGSNAAINNLVTKHVVDVPVETISYQQNTDGSNVTILSGLLRTYKADGKGLIDSVYGLKIASPIALASFKFSNATTGVLPIGGIPGAYSKSSAYEPRLNSVSYDSFGNLIEQHVQYGPYISYKWGYKNACPIVRINNAEPNEFYYEGFEESTATGVTTGAAHTGNNYTTVATINWTRPNSRGYAISYWYLVGSTWQFSGKLPYTLNTYNMQKTGATGYDDIRIYPTDALMTTYTYDPLLGLTSGTDEKNKTIYYDYDSIQRLINISDKDRNIVKHTDYHYQGQ